MVKIALPIEIKNRELIGKVWLSMALAANGHTVVIGSKSAVRGGAVDEIRPDVFFAKDASFSEGRLEVLRKLHEEGCYNVVLDSEGGVIDSKDDYFERRVSERILEYVDIIFAWGEEPASVIRERTDFDDDRLRITGNPRFDILRPELRSIYQAEAENLRSTYGKYVLVNTNMVVANPYEDSIREMIMESLPPEVAQRRLIKEKDVVEQLTTGLCRIATKSDRKFIIRPHPTENPEFYARQFEGVPSVATNYDGDVRPWILGADAVVHYRSTTGIESALLNTLPLAFEPMDDFEQSYGSTLPRTVSKRISSINEIPELLNERGSGAITYTLSDSQKKSLLPYFANVDTPAAPKIATILTRFFDDRDPKSNSSLLWTKRVKQRIKASPAAPYIQRLRGLEPGGTDYLEHKNPGITEKEITEIINHYEGQFDVNQLRVSRLNYLKDLFRIVAEPKA